ncbi:hypothetical protein NAP1_12158 [Erythrobacter sp. NAP1]|uniref:DUF2163 domain-containing protein n=1 Tax=Erythrobacter sp. NAP1 TaxID=237727 RepID=UPI000068760A|nr:hypothetical protein NAP1_12158 [Erythrobacter sp. NAP1]
MRRFFSSELETAATFWRIFRRDGVAYGFTSHNRDLLIDGITHRAAPGMVPAAIRMTSDLSEDSAGVEGALSHASIREDDLANGLFDDATIEVGIVDWETLDHHTIYSGILGSIEDDGRAFSGELKSAKHILERDLVPRTSPTCRAQFCGPGCGLSAPRFTSRRTVAAVDHERNRIKVADVLAADHIEGQVRFLVGPQTGSVFGVLGGEEDWLTLDRPISAQIEAGVQAELLQGCDHLLATCTSRFGNSINFRGEPFLPGNDLLARYGNGSR